MRDLFRIPAPASAAAGQVDSVFLFILVIGAFFFVVTQGALIYFAIRYRRRKTDAEEPETPQIKSNVVLEGILIIVPSLLIFDIFAYGYIVYMRMETPLQGATEINVVARQWSWEFEYPDGRKSGNELRLALGEPYHLVMTSEDVIHSLFIPEFRIKQDILPGRYTHMWLLPERTGEFDILCAEYCGVGHSIMTAKLIVMDPPAYHEWQEKAEAAGATVTAAERGKRIVGTTGCLACHSTDGSKKVGPTFKGLFGGPVTLSDGSVITADEDYIRESIMQPNAKVVKDFQAIMPTFTSTLSREDITEIIAYLKTLGAGVGAAAPGTAGAEEGRPSKASGRSVMENAGCLACHSTDGSRGVGPSLKGLFGRSVELEGGGRVKADEAYIIESIEKPKAKVVKGFQPIMPDYEGRFSDEELHAVVEYIESLK